MTPTPIRCVRVSADLWALAQAKAAKEDKSVSTVILDALKAYVADK